MPGDHQVNDYIAGALAGSAGLVAGHPLDTTKVQIQTQVSGAHYRNTWDCIKAVNKQGWTKGFFRGMSWPVLSYGAVNSLFFGVYGNTLSFLHRHNNGSVGTPRYWEIYLAGCVGGAAQLSIACPIDLVKVVLQSQIPRGKTAKSTSSLVGRYQGPWGCATDLVRRHGILALYRGVLTMAYRDLPTFGLYTVTYEGLFKLLCNQPWVDQQEIVANLLAGGLAGVATWLPVIPLDVAKTRLQSDIHHTQYKGILDCLVKNCKTGGLSTLFQGGGLICVRAFLVNAITFLVYSKSKTVLANVSL